MDMKNELQSDDDFDCSNGVYSDNYNNNSNSSYNGRGSPQNKNPKRLSKAELRKTNKPLMEKKRRMRINNCLEELKSLILEAMKKDPARHTKLEKADILEMTVKHLQSIQRQQLNMAIQTDPTIIHKFKTGFVECAEEVNRFIAQVDGIDAGVRQRLSNHLNNCASSLEQIGSMTNFNNGYRSQLARNGVAAASLFTNAIANPLVSGGVGATITTPNAIFPPLPQDFNNNSSNPVAPIQMGNLQLIPSRLPSGEFALIMPNSNANAANLLNNNNNNNNNTNINNNNNNNNSSSCNKNALNNSTFSNWSAHAPNATATTPLSATNTQLNFNTNFHSAFSKPQIQQQQPKIITLTNSHIISNNNNNNNSINNSNIITNNLKNNTNSNNSSLNNINCNNNNNNNNNNSYCKTTQLHPTTIFQPTANNNLHHNSTATASPPLSPISSVSSHCDDSVMHTSSDFAASRPATPPQETNAISQHNFSDVFSTPSSAESSLSLSLSLSRTSTHLQQQQVTSTSGSESNCSLKRSYSETADSSDSSDEPSSKKYAKAAIGREHEVGISQEERDSMWRPW